MLRNTTSVVAVLLLAAANVSGTQTVKQGDTTSKVTWSGNWAARTASGTTLSGTWTAVPDSTTGTVVGTWTLVDSQGGTIAGGAWSAAKALEEWTGAWRAVISGRTGEYLGTFTASVDLKGDTRFANLFEKAVQELVSGTWRAGNHSGAWSIRSRPAVKR